MFGEGLKIWIEDVVPADKEAELERMKLLAMHNSLTINELRQFAGLPEMPFGDILVGAPKKVEDVLRGAVNGMMTHHIAGALNVMNATE